MKRTNPNQLSLFDEEPCSTNPSSNPLPKPGPQSTKMPSLLSTAASAQSLSSQPSAPELSHWKNETDLRPDLATDHREGLILQIRRDLETLANPVYAFDHVFLRQRVEDYRAEVLSL